MYATAKETKRRNKRAHNHKSITVLILIKGPIHVIDFTVPGVEPPLPPPPVKQVPGEL